MSAISLISTLLQPSTCIIFCGCRPEEGRGIVNNRQYHIQRSRGEGGRRESGAATKSLPSSERSRSPQARCLRQRLLERPSRGCRHAQPRRRPQSPRAARPARWLRCARAEVVRVCQHATCAALLFQNSYAGQHEKHKRACQLVSAAGNERMSPFAVKVAVAVVLQLGHASAARVSAACARAVAFSTRVAHVLAPESRPRGTTTLCKACFVAAVRAQTPPVAAAAEIDHLSHISGQ